MQVKPFQARIEMSKEELSAFGLVSSNKTAIDLFIYGLLATRGFSIPAASNLRLRKVNHNNGNPVNNLFEATLWIKDDS